MNEKGYNITTLFKWALTAFTMGFKTFSGRELMVPPESNIACKGPATSFVPIVILKL